MAAQRTVIETLSLNGASDGRIAGLYQARYALLAAGGGAAGAAEKAEAPPLLDRVRDALDAALADVAAYRHELMLRSLRR